MRYQIRDKETGKWRCYGTTDELLETDDLGLAKELAREGADYGHDDEVVDMQTGEVVPLA